MWNFVRNGLISDKNARLSLTMRPAFSQSEVSVDDKSMSVILLRQKVWSHQLLERESTKTVGTQDLGAKHAANKIGNKITGGDERSRLHRKTN